MSVVFLGGVFRKPELMQWFMRSRVQLMKAPGSMQGKKIDRWKPWPYPEKKWFMVTMLFDLSASKAAAIPPQSCIGNKSVLRGRGHCIVPSAVQM